MDGLEATIIVKHEHGLHARPADLFVRKANEFQSSIKICNIKNFSRWVDAKSILGILSLGVHSGDSIKITSDGPDSAEAINALTKLVDGNFKD